MESSSSKTISKTKKLNKVKFAQAKKKKVFRMKSKPSSAKPKSTNVKPKTPGSAGDVATSSVESPSPVIAKEDRVVFSEDITETEQEEPEIKIETIVVVVSNSDTYSNDAAMISVVPNVHTTIIQVDSNELTRVVTVSECKLWKLGGTKVGKYFLPKKYEGRTISLTEFLRWFHVDDRPNNTVNRIYAQESKRLAFVPYADQITCAESPCIAKSINVPGEAFTDDMVLYLTTGETTVVPALLALDSMEQLEEYVAEHMHPALLDPFSYFVSVLEQLDAFIFANDGAAILIRRLITDTNSVESLLKALTIFTHWTESGFDVCSFNDSKTRDRVLTMCKQKLQASLGLGDVIEDGDSESEVLPALAAVDISSDEEDEDDASSFHFDVSDTESSPDEPVLALPEFRESDVIVDLLNMLKVPISIGNMAVWLDDAVDILISCLDPVTPKDHIFRFTLPPMISVLLSHILRSIVPATGPVSPGHYDNSFIQTIMVLYICVLDKATRCAATTSASLLSIRCPDYVNLSRRRLFGGELYDYYLTFLDDDAPVILPEIAFTQYHNERAVSSYNYPTFIDELLAILDYDASLSFFRYDVLTSFIYGCASLPDLLKKTVQEQSIQLPGL